MQKPRGKKGKNGARGQCSLCWSPTNFSFFSSGLFQFFLFLTVFLYLFSFFSFFSSFFLPWGARHHQPAASSLTDPAAPIQTPEPPIHWLPPPDSCLQAHGCCNSPPDPSQTKPPDTNQPPNKPALTLWSFLLK